MTTAEIKRGAKAILRSKIKFGEEVKVVANIHGHHFKTGETVKCVGHPHAFKDLSEKYYPYAFYTFQGADGKVRLLGEKEVSQITNKKWYQFWKK